MFFSKKQNNIENQAITHFEIKEKIPQNIIFSEQIKFESNSQNQEYERKKFIENLTNNPDLLQDFSNERLEKILQYYLDENKKKRNILKKLTA